MEKSPVLSAADRIIRNCSGLYFKSGTWTLDKSEATIFRTLQDALRARTKYDLENIMIVTWERDEFPSNYLN